MVVLTYNLSSENLKFEFIGSEGELSAVLFHAVQIILEKYEVVKDST